MLLSAGRPSDSGSARTRSKVHREPKSLRGVLLLSVCAGMKLSKARLVFGAVILLLGLTAPIAFLPPGNSLPDPVRVLPESYQISSPIPLFARWVPATPGWAWLWHLKESVCGKIKPVSIDTDIVAVSQMTIPFGVPTFDGQGSLKATRLRVWLADIAQLKSFRRQMERGAGVTFVNSPRIITGDGIGASLFVGETIILNGATNETGVRVSYFTRVRKDLLDLTATIGVMQPMTNEALAISLRTNLDVKARFQIPKGKGIFLLQFFQDQPDQGAMAVIISPKP